MAVARKCYSFKEFSAESNLLTKRKNHSFPDTYSYELFLCFDVNSFLKFVQAFRYTLYILSRKTNPERPHPSKDDAIQRDSQGWCGCNC